MNTIESTPIRRQYLDLKRKYADCILFFRLGDFYETFDGDAELISRELDVVLTSRAVGKDTRVPMAGVPHHAADTYVARLIERGYRVAIAEQLGAETINGLVPREVRRVVTPGTVVEPAMLEAGEASYLAAVITTDDGGRTTTEDERPTTDDPSSVVVRPSSSGLAYCDITTGEFAATQLDGPIELERELARLRPREILKPEKGDWKAAGQSSVLQSHMTPYPAYRFEHGNARQTLLDQFKVQTLAGFGIDDKPLALRAAGAIIAYLRDTQPAALAQLTELRAYSTSQFMGLDAVTRRNLELTEGLRSRAKQGSLLGVLDKTLTPMGARMLRAWVSQPLLDRPAIEERLKRIDAYYTDTLLRAQLRDALKNMADLERLTSRVITGIATPKDLLNLKAAAQQALVIGNLVTGNLVTGNLVTGNLVTGNLVTGDSVTGDGDQSPITNYQLPVTNYQLPSAALTQVVDLIDAAIKDEPDDDGFIKPSYCAELDGVHASARSAKTWIASLERVERDRTGIKSLKVGFNKVFGYYIEVTHANVSAIPSDYIRKQTLTNAERYITPELKERETLVLNADERTAEIEARLLHDLNTSIAEQHANALMSAAHTVARLDVASGLAEVAARNHYCRPTFNTDGRIDILAGRHPVIEQLLKEVPYTPNDVNVDHDARILIITGPNMSGKSSYMRQVALTVLLAQIGSYVPAQSADLCLVDRIFTRIGAQDELTAGQSTFMVEMVETANILHHCTPRSLVILDEIGRGTSTYDGLAIAWSVIEFLHNHPERRAVTLFATHYHELIQLAEKLPHVRNYNVAVSDEGGQVVFLHKVIPGGADKSYGIHVAQLAGLPPTIVHRAQDILKQLQDGTLQSQPGDFKPVEQLTMFVTEPPALARLKDVDPDEMSPLEALTTLYELKKLLKGSKRKD